MTHLSASDIDALVLGDTLPRGDARLVHLATCPECAHRLACEARAELALQDAVASSEAGAAHPTSRWVFAAAAMLMLLLAAGLYVAAIPTRPLARHGFHSTSSKAQDAPGLVDPISLEPGHDVMPPDMPGLNAATAAPTDSLD